MRRKIPIIILLFFIFYNLTINTTYAVNDVSQDYEIYQNRDDIKDIQIYSDKAILMDNSTMTVLYSKNAYDKVYPASTTKILTAIIALENCNLDDVVTVNQSAVSAIPAGYSSAGLVAGEQVNVKDLLTVFLVHSANDAGYVLAEHISGNIKDFANLMNKKALDIGCKNTNFTNPSGIHDDNHYTTAYDLALIARYCMKNSTFRTIVALPTCTINATNKSAARTYSNTNDLLNSSSRYFLKDCIGIKTGFTSAAKDCLISACNRNGFELISVVLGANSLENGESSRYADSIGLFDFGYSNFSIRPIEHKVNQVTTTENEKENESVDQNIPIYNDEDYLFMVVFVIVLTMIVLLVGLIIIYNILKLKDSEF